MIRAGHAVGRLVDVVSRSVALALLAGCGEPEAVGTATESFGSGTGSVDHGFETMGGWSGSTGWVTTGPDDPDRRRPNWYDPGRFWSGDALALREGYRLGGEIAVTLPSDAG